MDLGRRLGTVVFGLGPQGHPSTYGLFPCVLHILVISSNCMAFYCEIKGCHDTYCTIMQLARHLQAFVYCTRLIKRRNSALLNVNSLLPTVKDRLAYKSNRLEFNFCKKAVWYHTNPGYDSRFFGFSKKMACCVRKETW